MAINIKFTKFDNTPWGFRLAGGSDFPQPLTVIRVTEGSLAECMGLKVGDVVVRLNDESVSSMTHGQAHEEVMRAGNNFILGVKRGEDSIKVAEALSEENIVPYKIQLADLPPVFPEQILKEEIVIEQREEITCEVKSSEETIEPEVNLLPDKPTDANSEIVPNQNLTDDEIAQLILEEEELLNDKGVLGVNFKKLRPRATVLKQSKVIEELQNIATAEPPLVEQLKRTSVFLQKPQRPIPEVRKKPEEQEETEVESYRVVIKKQKKRSVTDRLLEKGLLKPGDASTPEPPTPEVNMECNEMAMQIEEGDSLNVLSEPLDDNLYSHSLETAPSSMRFVVPSTSLVPQNECLSSQLSVDTKVEDPTHSEATVAPGELSKLKENIFPRRVVGKRKVKGYCTRAHYIRRCLFGKKSHDDTRAVKVRSLFRGYIQENNNFNSVETNNCSGQLLPKMQHRGSVDISSRYRIKGRYLETYLKREDNWMKRMLDGLFEKPDSFFSSKLFNRLVSSKEVSLRRTRYGERILIRTVEFVALRLRSDILKHLEQTWLTNVRKPAESRIEIGKRLRFKGRYFQRTFWYNVARLVNCIKSMTSFKNIRHKNRRNSSMMIKTKGHYLEAYLLEKVFFDLSDLRKRFSTYPSVVSSKRKFFTRTHYIERILKKHFESLGLMIRYIRSQILRAISDSSVADSVCLSQNRNENCTPVAPEKEDDGLFNFVRSSKDFLSEELFHRGCRRLSKSSRNSISAGSKSTPNTFRNVFFNWLPSKSNKNLIDRTINDSKIVQNNDGRRLSFVPTILYEGLTNHIGVDFTRFVAFAFVPCTSIILLYMYK